MKNKKIKLFYLAVILFVMAFFSYQKVFAATAPPLKEGTYLTGQTLSVWPSWSALGNMLGIALPIDPINQLALAGTCSASTNRFCTADNQCPSGETCILHDPATGWSVADKRFSFACSRESYAYRYIASTTPGFYTVRARFEDPGIPIANFNTFVSEFVSTSIFRTNEESGVCYFDQEISTMQAGVCGDGKLNAARGEQCDPPGVIEYKTGCRGSIKDLTVCGSNCRWVASTTLCSALSKCGNGAVEVGETCDDGNLNGKYNHCNTLCNGISALGRCGDGVLQSAYEVCDPGAVLSGGDRYSLDKANSCKWDCQNFGPYCGDGIIQTQFGEECEGDQQCVTTDGRPGVKVCASNCKMSPAAASAENWVCAVGAAATTSAPGTCGDAVVGENEACDRGLANNGRSCVPGYGAPCSYCSADCRNTIDVQPIQYCGNSIIENPERCEVSGGAVYSATANPSSTFTSLNAFTNGYQELACLAETPAPHTIKKGTKTCADCSAGAVRNCVQCGASKSGVSVEGDIINVLDNSLEAGFDGRSPDPLFAKITDNSALNLVIGGSCALQSIGQILGGPPIFLAPCDITMPNSPTVANIVKNRASSDLVSYSLRNPYLAGSPAALINSDPICSTDENPNYKYQMYINSDWTRPRNFPVVAEPQGWQYDMALSPVVLRSLRPNDLRVVASWVGSADFYSGVLNPFVVAPASPEIEGPSYMTLEYPDCIGGSCVYQYRYATGTNYYLREGSFNPADRTNYYKKYGIWYHGFDSTSGQTSVEAFTIDTAAMESNTYAFYVRSPSFPIRQFKNTARLKVDVYLPEDDTNQYHFGVPLKTYYFNAAVSSANPNARYWQVFNINKPSATLSAADIIDVSAIVTGPASFIYFTPPSASTPIYTTVVPPCTDADWTSSLSPTPCPSSGTQTRTWTPIGLCSGGVTHPALETVFCTYTPSVLSVSCSAFPTSINTGGSAAWTAVPTGGTGSYTYSWSGMDGLPNINSQSVSHTYSTAGTKTATVNVISGAQSASQACSNSVTVTTAIPPLSVSCSGSPSALTTGQSAAWTAVPTGGTGSYTYSWSGMDGLPNINSQSVSHIYSSAGTKTASVNVISGAQSMSQACGNVTVTTAIPPLSVSCSGSPSAITTGQSATWTAMPNGGTGSYTYSWSGMDGLPNINSQSVSHTYSTAGTKTATVNVISGAQSVTQPCGNVTVAVPITVPFAPTGLAAAPGNAQASLSWNASTNGGSPITGYRIYRRLASGSYDTNYSSSAVTSWTNNGLVNGTTYYYRVTAVNAIGESSSSAEAGVTPRPTVPVAPVLSVTGYGNGYVSISWTVPSSDGGSPIDGYMVYRGTSSGGYDIAIQPGAGTTFTSTGLTNGVTYYFMVRAANSVGSSPYSNEVSAMPRTASKPLP